MTQRNLGTIILVCAIAILLIAVVRGVIWHADIGGSVALGCVFVALGIAVRRGQFDGNGERS